MGPYLRRNAWERTYADEHVGPSDGIEKYFAVADMLARTNPNQDPVHRECQLAIMEVSYGTQLMELLETDRTQAHNIMLLCRQFGPEYKKMILERAKLTMETRIQKLREAIKSSKEKAEEVAAELELLKQLADKYHYPDTAAKLAAHRAELLHMSAKERKTHLTQHFDMYLKVHKLNTEQTL